MKIINIIRRINGVLNDSQYTYTQLYEHINMCISTLNSALKEPYRQVPYFPTPDEMQADKTANGVSTLEYSYIPEHYLGFLVYGVAAAALAIEEDMDSQYNYYLSLSHQKLSDLVKHLRILLPVPPISTSFSFGVPVSKRVLPVITIDNYSTCYVGTQTPSLTCNNPYGRLYRENPTQIIKLGDNDCVYIFEVNDNCKPYYASVKMHVIIVGKDPLDITEEISVVEYPTITQYIDANLPGVVASQLPDVVASQLPDAIQGAFENYYTKENTVEVIKVSDANGESTNLIARLTSMTTTGTYIVDWTVGDSTYTIEVDNVGKSANELRQTIKYDTNYSGDYTQLIKTRTQNVAGGPWTVGFDEFVFGYNSTKEKFYFTNKDGTTDYINDKHFLEFESYELFAVWQNQLEKAGVYHAIVAEKDVIRILVEITSTGSIRQVREQFTNAGESYGYDFPAIIIQQRTFALGTGSVNNEWSQVLADQPNVYIGNWDTLEKPGIYFCPTFINGKYDFTYLQVSNRIGDPEDNTIYQTYISWHPQREMQVWGMRSFQPGMGAGTQFIEKKLAEIPLEGSGAPLTTTKGYYIGQIYRDYTNDKWYRLRSWNGENSYLATDFTWIEEIMAKPDGVNNLIDVNGKVNSVYLAINVKGMYPGGDFNATTGVATLSLGSQEKLGITDATIVLTNDATAITGYLANNNAWFMVKTAGTFAGHNFNINDHLVSYGNAWTKIDNTDSVNSVNGKVGALVLTQEDILDGITFKQYSAADKSKLALYPVVSSYGGTLVTNLDTILYSNFYTAYAGATGNPFTNSTHLVHLNSSVGTGGAYQMAVDFLTGAKKERIKNANIWGAWKDISSGGSSTTSFSEVTLPVIDFEAVEGTDILLYEGPYYINNRGVWYQLTTGDFAYLMEPNDYPFANFSFTRGDGYEIVYAKAEKFNVGERIISLYFADPTLDTNNIFLKITATALYVSVGMYQAIGNVQDFIYHSTSVTYKIDVPDVLTDSEYIELYIQDASLGDASIAELNKIVERNTATNILTFTSNHIPTVDIDLICMKQGNETVKRTEIPISNCPQKLVSTFPFVILTSDWAALNSKEPYAYSATITVLHTVGDTIVDCVFGDIVLASKNGIILFSATDSIETCTLVFYSVTVPSSIVNGEVLKNVKYN